MDDQIDVVVDSDCVGIMTRLVHTRVAVAVDENNLDTRYS